MQQTVLSEESRVSLPSTGVVSTPARRTHRSAWALVLFLAFATFVYLNIHFAVVDGISMLPTFKNGQRLTYCSAYWLVGPIRDGDVVIIKDDYKDSKTGFIVKRVYKMAGEKVDLGNSPRNWDISKGLYTVPPGCVYVLGDNRPKSEDSRYLGAIPMNKVLGKVLVKP